MALSKQDNSLLISKLVSMLHEHASVLDEAENTALIARAKNDYSAIDNIIYRLRIVRERVREHIVEAMNAAKDLDESDAEDLVSLLAYFVEAGAKREERLLHRLSNVASVDRDLNELRDLVSLASKVVERLIK